MTHAHPCPEPNPPAVLEQLLAHYRRHPGRLRAAVADLAGQTSTRVGAELLEFLRRLVLSLQDERTRPIEDQPQPDFDRRLAELEGRVAKLEAARVPTAEILQEILERVVAIAPAEETRRHARLTIQGLRLLHELLTAPQPAVSLGCVFSDPLPETRT